MIKPTMEEVMRAAKEEGAEPLYTQSFWRACVRFLLAKLDEKKSG